jgi:hypothetical protein
MNFINTILEALSVTMPTPEPYGWFHLMMFALMVGFTIFMVAKFKNADEKQTKRILLAFSITMLLLEVYKQINFSYTNSWNYRWYAFPFQFCSVPMYIILMAAFTKKGALQESLYAFLGTYTLFAGLAVMLYPTDIFVSTIGINIQTSVHHGLMVVIGVYMLASGKVKLHHKTILKALPVFLVVFLMAFAMNYITRFAGLEDTFNMFFISPYFANHLPILSGIQANAPYLVFLLTYVVGFTFVAYLMLLIAIILKIVKQKIVLCYTKKNKA